MAHQIDHRDIWIESDETLSWRQSYDEYLNYENLIINESSYTDYRPTRLQFHFFSATTRQSIQVKIPYHNRLERVHVKHAAVCRYDSETNQWKIVQHTVNEKEKKIEFKTDRIGIYTIFINHYWYSRFTQRMADEYPNWTKIRTSRESTGQQFLNYFGIELETLHDYIEWISEQKYIATADIHLLDWIYQYQLPKVKMTDTLHVTKLDNGESVPVLETLKDFFYNDQNQGVIIDYEENKIYTSFAYGELQLRIEREDKVVEHKIEPIHYHLWNTFDEFGLLLGIERQHLEDNKSFKERILDVFRYPSGTHSRGLTNGIARDLGLIERKDKNGKELIWQDDSKDFFLKNSSGKSIDLHSLRIDNQELEEDMFEIDELGNIRIYARHEGASHDISFIYGIEKYQLYDKENRDVYKMLFQPDGQATSKMLKWVEYINTIAPVMWDRFTWDEGFWDTIDKDLTGLGYVPNMWDSNIDSWKDYVFESER